jgi:division protein CdvB (Snf7/Vps24/ESCRT-III family)
MGTIESNVEKTVSKLEDQLKLWGAKLNELAAKADVAGKEAKIDARKHLDEMKANLKVAQSKLDEAKTAGADKWDKFKSGIESSWKELEGAFQKLIH